MRLNNKTISNRVEHMCFESLSTIKIDASNYRMSLPDKINGNQRKLEKSIHEVVIGITGYESASPRIVGVINP